MHARSFPKSFDGLVRLYTTDHLSRGTPLTKTRFTIRHVRIASAASASDLEGVFDQCVCVNSAIDSKRRTESIRVNVVVVNLCRVRVRASIASSIVHSVDDEDDAFLVRLLVVVAFRGGFIRNVATTTISANGSSTIILRASCYAKAIIRSIV
jgi:hypothetical protein